jgi:hypothetical protein
MPTQDGSGSGNSTRPDRNGDSIYVNLGRSWVLRTRLDCREHALGRERDLGQPHADCVMDRVGDRARNAEHPSFPDAFGAEWARAAMLEMTASNRSGRSTACGTR